MMIVVGRDRLVDTHPGWMQTHQRFLVGDLPISELNEAEAVEYIRGRGIADEEVIARIVAETQCYPYLLQSEVEAHIDGLGSALALENFFKRTTRWMSEEQKKWTKPIAFLKEVTIDTIARVLPKDDAPRIMEWFKGEASLRSPRSAGWSMLPIISSKIQACVRKRVGRVIRRADAESSRPSGGINGIVARMRMTGIVVLGMFSLGAAACGSESDNDSKATYRTVFGVGVFGDLLRFTVTKLESGICTSVSLIASDEFPSALSTPPSWSVESVYIRANAASCDTLPNAATDWPATASGALTFDDSSMYRPCSVSIDAIVTPAANRGDDPVPSALPTMETMQKTGIQAFTAKCGE